MGFGCHGWVLVVMWSERDWRTLMLIGSIIFIWRVTERRCSKDCFISFPSPSIARILASLVSTCRLHLFLSWSMAQVLLPCLVCPFPLLVAAVRVLSGALPIKLHVIAYPVVCCLPCVPYHLTRLLLALPQNTHCKANGSCKKWALWVLSMYF